MDHQEKLELIEKIKADRTKGYSYLAIAQKHGVAESTVRHYLRSSEAENQKSKDQK